MKYKIKNRKGFTLVELIVVIAIIGVLAAILIPTMIGYTIQAQVTSADTTASKIRSSITYFLTNADVNGYGFIPSTGNYCHGEITVDKSLWKVEITEGEVSDVFYSKNISWKGSGSAKKGDSKLTDCAEELLAVTLADSFPSIETAKIGFRIEGGECCACYFTSETNSSIDAPDFGAGCWSSDSYKWNGEHAGISSDGYTVGTAPSLPLSKS